MRPNMPWIGATVIGIVSIACGLLPLGRWLPGWVSVAFELPVHPWARCLSIGLGVLILIAVVLLWIRELRQKPEGLNGGMGDPNTKSG